MYKRFIHLFVLSCRKATLLTEKKLHAPLSPLEDLQLRTHLSLCPYCTAYTYKAAFLDKLLSEGHPEATGDNNFSQQEIDDLNERVKSAIREQ